MYSVFRRSPFPDYLNPLPLSQEPLGMADKTGLSVLRVIARKMSQSDERLIMDDDILAIETEPLKSMWNEQVSRSTKLIVGEVIYNNNAGSFNNKHWNYDVSYASRDALDIKYEKRTKGKADYYVWTQGPLINFQVGDLFISKINKTAVQVIQASPMGWSKERGKMYEGSIAYEEFYIDNSGRYTKKGLHTCSQMGFLILLIYGNIILYDYPSQPI